MLHLQAGVHLHEIDGLVGQVENELHSAGADVAHCLGNGRGMLEHILAQLRRQQGGAGFLEQLLLVPLHAAIPQAKHPGVALGVAQKLHLDVAQRGHELLQVQIAIAKGAARLGGDPMKQLMEVRGPLHRLNALAAAAMHGLDEHRVADLGGHLGGPLRIGEDALAAGHHRHFQTHGRGDGVGLVAHGLHAGHRRSDEVDAPAADQFRELGALRQKADARMQGVHLLLFSDAQHAAGVQIALVRGVAADANQRVPIRQPVRHCGFHVWVRLHQHQFQAMLLANAQQLGGGAAPGVNQHPLRWTHQIRIGVGRTVGRGGRPLFDQRAGQHPLDGLRHGLLRHRDVRVDLAQFVVQIGMEGMLHQALHGFLVRRQVVRKNGIQRQVARHHDLPRERHAGAGEVIGLRQRMGDEAGLGAAGAVAVAEQDERQVVVPHEAGDAVVHRGHGEQRPSAFLGLHAARRNEADHRQPPLRALHQQSAELLRAGHVERTRLESGVGQRQPAAPPPPLPAILEAGDPRNDAAGRRTFVQGVLDGLAEAGEPARVCAHQIAKPLLPIVEKCGDDVLMGERALRPALAHDLLHQQISVGHVQAIPEILAPADVLRRDAAVVRLVLPLSLNERRQQILKQAGHHHEQRIREVRKAGPLPFLHGAEEFSALGQLGHAPVPIEESVAKLP